MTKRQSGTRSPSWTLDEAIEMAKKVKQAIGLGSASGDVVAKGLGHTSIQNGTATRKIGTLTHYGLLEREGGRKYRLSDLARRICTPRSEDEKQEAIAEAAKNPTLYSGLIEKYDGHALPTLLPNILSREFNVTEKSAEGVSENFARTMEQAGLLRNGILYSYLDHEPGTVSENEPTHEVRSPTTVSVDRPAASSSGVESAAMDLGGHTDTIRYQIPLARRRLAFIVLPMVATDEDVDRVSRWIEFNREVLINNEAADREIGG